MNTFNIFTNTKDSLPQGRADFLLAASVTHTCEIEGITQTGQTTLTPTLDAEFITNEKIISLKEATQSPTKALIPRLITRAVHNLNPFFSIEILNLGLPTQPQSVNIHNFGIEASGSLSDGLGIDAKAIFKKGMDFGKSYELKGNYLIMGESIPSGTVTATTSCLALGYDCVGSFSLNSIQAQTVQKALSCINDEMSNFEKLSIVSDNMLLFCAGFLLEATRRFHVVLAGGTQMAACLLIADKLREDVLMQLKSDNLTLATTAWVTKDHDSDIKHLLSHLSYQPHAIYTEFSFTDAEIPLLKEYNSDDIKEGVGAGASLAYASTNTLNNTQVLNEIELLIYGM